MFKKIPLSYLSKSRVKSRAKRLAACTLMIGLALGWAQSFALTTQPSSYQSMAYRSAIVAIINQLQSVKPLITQAEDAAPKNARITLHFESWKDQYGKAHNGVRNDIDAIQSALIQALNNTAIEPRPIQPLKADFIGGLK